MMASSRSSETRTAHFPEATSEETCGAKQKREIEIE